MTWALVSSASGSKPRALTLAQLLASLRPSFRVRPTRMVAVLACAGGTGEHVTSLRPELEPWGAWRT